LWALAVAGESLADAQLRAFKSDPAHKGQVCRAGLWAYSRHPNYFCEWLIWCAYALLAISAPYGWLGLLSPAIILFLLVKVTGIPPTEKQSLRSRGPAYARYQNEVSAFFPWFPRSKT
jgi:steroid 5-alpha reductase family enzyme